MQLPTYCMNAALTVDGPHLSPANKSSHTISHINQPKMAVVAPARFCVAPEEERRRSLRTGEAVELHCDLSDPSAQVYWYKDGEQIFNQPGIDLVEEGLRRTLIIQSADFSHAGVYTCQSVDDVTAFQVEVQGDCLTEEGE